MARYFGIEDGRGRLPRAILQQRDVVLADEDGSLAVRVTNAGRLRLIFLDEHDVRINTLTLREREVLELVADGRDNGAIANELGVASATVAKHLEHVYEKLGVRNRTAAARLLRSRVC